MKKLRLILTVLIILVLNSCATLMFEPIEKNLDSWVGASEDELYMSWGPPSVIQELSNGNKMVVYTDAYYQTTGGFYFDGKWIPQNNSHLTCKIMFILNTDNIVISNSYEGNYGPLRKIVRPRY